MDLTTLIAACALTADPKLIHALVWHQSGGEPFAFEVPGERRPQVFKSSSAAVRAARTVRPDTLVIRVGLAGLPATATSVTAAMFAPCANITALARAITELNGACRVSARAREDGGACAIAAWHGSWERPDDGFAARVLATVARGDAPDFRMGEDAGAPAPAPAPGAAPAAPPAFAPPAPGNEERASASPLFPRADRPSGGAPMARSTGGGTVAGVPKDDAGTSPKPASRPPSGSLFVPRSVPPSTAKTE